MSEINRVLTNDGVFICVVPTFAWKVLQMLLYYPTTVYRLIRSQIKDHSKSRIRACTRYFFPSIHGEFDGNIEESRAYMIKNWIALLESNGFEICKIKRLVLYVPLGKLREKNITIVPPALKIEKLLGLSSSIMLLARPRKMSSFRWHKIE